MYLAEASLFSVIAMSLAVFDITKAVENGVEITPVHEGTSGIIRYAWSIFVPTFPEQMLRSQLSQEFQMHDQAEVREGGRTHRPRLPSLKEPVFIIHACLHSLEVRICTTIHT